MDEIRAKFTARIAMHLRDGWEVVRIHDEPPEPLAAILTKAAIGQPRPTGKGVHGQDGTTTRYCRRIVVDHQGVIRVTTVACPPELLTQRGGDDARS